MKRNLFLLLMLFVANIVFAQTVKITGRVSDTDGQPMIGVNVTEQGTINGVVTGFNGDFAIEVDSDASLVFTFIGYKKEVVGVSGKQKIEVTLEEDFLRVDEVVVTALGIKRDKKGLGYAVQNVDDKSLGESSDPNLLNSLNGKVAGIQITQGNSGVGSSSKMVIRGENSLANDNQPLFVIDGVPINNYTAPSVTTSDGSGAQEVDYGNGAGEVNPDDVESISVLKGANAAALYGSRAANGVVLITTKSGAKTKGIGVSVNSTTTFEDILVVPSFQNLYGQGSKGQFSFVDGYGAGTQDDVDESWGPAFSEFDKLPQFDSPSTDINGNPVRACDLNARFLGYSADGSKMYTDITPTEWKANETNVEDFFETGITFKNNIALTGSNDNGNFRLSYTNLNSEGIIPNVNLKRNTLSLNAGYKFTPRFSVKTSISYLNSKSDNRPAMGYGPENPMYLFAWYGRNLNTQSFKDYWQEGMENIEQATYNIWHENPYFNMYENTNAYDKNRMFGNIVANLQLTDHLSLMARTGIDWFFDNRVSKRAYSSKRFPKGMYRDDDVYFKEMNSDLLLIYNNNFGGYWNITAIVGGNHMTQENMFTSNVANELSIPNVYTLTNSSVPLVSTQYDTKKQINSLYALAQINYKEKIFIELTGRNDWSSTLPDGNNSYFYPSLSVSAVLSDMVDLPEVFNYAKVRAGAAAVGNDTDPYRLRSIYKYSTPYGSNYGLTDDDIIANSDLKPEQQQSYEIGANFVMANQRVGLDFTFYNNLNKNQIIQLPLAQSSGYKERYVNAGSIQNQGVEAMLNIQALRAKQGFNWNVMFNFSRNVGTVKSVSEGMKEYVYKWSTPYDNDDAKIYAIAKEGERLGDIYGTGFIKVDVDGEERIVYENGLPVRDPEIRKLGNYNPDFILGIGNEFEYKGFRLNVLFDWHQGGEIVSRFYSIASRTGVLDHTLLGRDLLSNGSYEDGVIGDGVLADANGNYVENTVKVDAQTYHKNFYRRVNEESATFDASFIKLRELSLGYTIPSRVLDKLPITGASVSIVGRNLVLWTSQNYFDPETGSYENESYMPGVEEMSYPSMRSIGFNFNFKF